MEGWNEFQALPIWFGIAIVVVTLVRLARRELAIRKQFLSSVDEKRGHCSSSDAADVGYVVPKGVLNPQGLSQWGYFVDANKKRRPTRIWWLLRAANLFLEGRKRDPIEAKDFKPIP